MKAFVRIVSILLLVLVTILKFDWGGGALYYSATLTKMVTEDGNVERINYLDEGGMPAFAEDLHYASVVKTRDDDGNVISEFYYDENGRPAEQQDGYYGLKRQYDAFGRNDRILYTDGNGDPMVTSLGYAMLEYVFDDEGRVIEQRYFDADGMPVENRYGAYGMIHTYDASGGRVTSTHVDREGHPYGITLGFATIRREFYENGSMKRAYFYDADGNPATSVHGHYGYYYEYDDEGRETVMSYTDSDGKPMMASVGYATVKKTYNDENDTVETEMYFDEKGNSIALSKGQYGVRFEGDNQVYLDENGQDKFSLYTTLYNNPLSVVFFALVICAISMTLNEKGNRLLLIGYLFFILFMTLMNRNADETLGSTAFLWSYRRFFRSRLLRQEILNNIWLFIPLGTILYRLTGWAGILAALGLSAVIEITQYTTGIGLAELDDIFSNSLGSFIGCGLADLIGHRIIAAPPGETHPSQ